MKKRLVWFVAALALWPVRTSFISGQEKPVGAHPRNIVIFVFDGLRAGSVNAVDAPTMFWIRNHAIRFTLGIRCSWMATSVARPEAMRLTSKIIEFLAIWTPNSTGTT